MNVIFPQLTIFFLYVQSILDPLFLLQYQAYLIWSHCCCPVLLIMDIDRNWWNTNFIKLVCFFTIQFHCYNVQYILPIIMYNKSRNINNWKSIYYLLFACKDAMLDEQWFVLFMNKVINDESDFDIPQISAFWIIGWHLGNIWVFGNC